MEQAIQIRLLGAPCVLRGGVAQPGPRGRKAWALLAYLACQPSGVPRPQLASLLFEDAEDPLAALRWNLSQLRRLLGGVPLGAEVVVLPRDRIGSIDVDAVAGGDWAEALRVPGLGRDLLEGMCFATSPAFEVWLATERRHLQASAEAVLREAALARLAVGAADQAADLAGRLVGLDPLDESFQALLVRSLAAAGDGIGAARQAAAATELFVRELGVAPGPALGAAMHTITAAPTARPTSGRAGAIAQLEAGEAAIGAGVLDAGLQCLRRAIVEADATGDAVLRTRARVALGAALVHAARGRDEEGAAALHEALAIGQSASSAHAAAACRELGYVEFLRGRYGRALTWLRRAVPLAGDDPAERARIATVHGSILSDTAHYAAAIAVLVEAESLAAGAGDARQVTYARSMRGRASLLCGDLAAAAEALDRSVDEARRGWTAFLPWPQALRAEVDLQLGLVEPAADGFERAFALGCQLGDPCWEGIAARGLGCVAIARGDNTPALEVLLDAIARCGRLPDAYLWAKASALEALCGLAVVQRLPQASHWIDGLLTLAARAGMRELTARAHLHRAMLGERSSAAVARLLVEAIGTPRLSALVAGWG